MRTPLPYLLLAAGWLAPSLASAEYTEPKKGPAAANADPKLVKMYEAGFYNDYKKTFSRGDRKELNMLGNFAEQQQILKTSGPPDTYWITGWDGVPAPHRELAVIQAGINRTWLKACHADFDAYEAKMKVARKGFDDDFAFVRAETTSFYEGADRLHQMWKRAAELFKKENLYLTRGHILNNAYIWGELVALEYELVKRTGRGSMSRYISPQWARERVRINPTDVNARRMVYCWSAAEAGTPTLPMLSQARDYAHTKGKSFIRHVFSKEEAKEAKAWADSARPVDPDAHSNDRIMHVTSVNAKAKPGGIVFVGYERLSPAFEVKSVSRKKGKTQVKLGFTRPGTQKYDCKTTNRVQRIAWDGELLYYADCKSRPTTFDVTAVVNFQDLPGSVDIKKGDKLGAFGRMTKIKTKQNKKKTKTKINVTLDGLHLRDIRRGGKDITSY
ncbi:MAG: hypothetical protein ACE366_22855 [Bradymonadia bacterium]